MGSRLRCRGQSQCCVPRCACTTAHHVSAPERRLADTVKAKERDIERLHRDITAHKSSEAAKERYSSCMARLLSHQQLAPTLQQPKHPLCPAGCCNRSPRNVRPARSAACARRREWRSQAAPGLTHSSPLICGPLSLPADNILQALQRTQTPKNHCSNLAVICGCDRRVLQDILTLGAVCSVAAGMQPPTASS
jgi:hypothetical protein